ncbi:Chromobox protein-like protein 1-like protein [Aphelenchoides besseyi]|nr:Chromobox protein-like protein 1-like protein [Aphelenchoides besseyi]
MGHKREIEKWDKEEEFEVEAIIDRRFYNGRIEYRVKWKNYDFDQNTWEPIENCTNCIEKVKAFEKKFDRLQKRTPYDKERYINEKKNLHKPPKYLRIESSSEDEQAPSTSKQSRQSKTKKKRKPQLQVPEEDSDSDYTASTKSSTSQKQPQNRIFEQPKRNRKRSSKHDTSSKSKKAKMENFVNTDHSGIEIIPIIPKKHKDIKLSRFNREQLKLSMSLSKSKTLKAAMTSKASGSSKTTDTLTKIPLDVDEMLAPFRDGQSSPSPVEDDTQSLVIDEEHRPDSHNSNVDYLLKLIFSSGEEDNDFFPEISDDSDDDSKMPNKTIASASVEITVKTEKSFQMLPTLS